MDWKQEIKIPRPSLSKLRRLLNSGPQLSLKKPSTKGSSLKRPSALSKGPEVKMPRFVADLFADLRERHLLPLVAVLIAAMIAAPLLLGNTSEKKKPAGATATVGGAAGETSDSSFTVIPAARHLRSPEKRLGHRQALNPFRVDTAAGEGESTEATGAGGSHESSGGGGEAAGSESSGGSSSVVASPVQPAAPEGSSTGGSTTENVTVQVNVTTFVANIKAGNVPGELSEEKKIPPMTKLPSANNPVVMFAGLSQDDKRALFLMTSKVTGYYGDVQCAVDKQACQMVELKPGHAAIFSYGLGGTEQRYKIVLQGIEPVVSSVESSTAKTEEKADHEHPAKRGSAVTQAIVGHSEIARR